MAFTSEELELAYLAGLFDGEGTFTFHRTKKILCDGTVSYYVIPWVSMANTDIRLIEKVRAKFGGRIWIGNPEKRNPNHKTCYRWDARSRLALAALEALIPYLVAKREQAEICLKIGRLNKKAVLDRHNGGVDQGRRKEQWKIDVETRAFNRIRELNHRGTAVQ